MTLTQALDALFATGASYGEVADIYPQLLKRYDPDAYYLQLTVADRNRLSKDSPCATAGCSTPVAPGHRHCGYHADLARVRKDQLKVRTPA